MWADAAHKCAKIIARQALENINSRLRNDLPLAARTPSSSCFGEKIAKGLIDQINALGVKVGSIQKAEFP